MRPNGPKEGPLTRILPPEVDAEIRRVLAEGRYSSIDELNLVVSDIMDRYNGTPQIELGSFSPSRLARLLNSDWTSPGSPIRLNSNLTLADLESARFLFNARLVLHHVLEEGGVKATAAGNLNRKFVTEMLDRMALADGRAESIRAANKVLNEPDLSPLHVIRILLKMAGLMRMTKGVFRITKNGKDLLTDSKAGDLYALLFVTLFRDFNMAYIFGGSDQWIVQDTVAFSLHQLSKLSNEWHDAGMLASTLLLPNIVKRLEPSEFPWRILSLCQSRIYGPLEEFGLIEMRDLPREDKWIRRYEVRKFNLFDRILTFDV